MPSIDTDYNRCWHSAVGDLTLVVVAVKVGVDVDAKSVDCRVDSTVRYWAPVKS